MYIPKTRPNLERTVAPTALGVTLDQAKTQCAIDLNETYWDNWFTDGTDGAIFAARDLVEYEANVSLVTATWVWELEDWAAIVDPPYFIELPVHPVSSVSSFAYLDENDASQTVSSDYWTLKTNEWRSRLYNDDLNYSWPVLSDKKPLPITITFAAGFASVPKAAQQAMLMLIGHWFANRESVLVGTVSKEIEQGFQSLINVLRPKVYR